MDYPARGRYANAALSPLEDDAMEWLDGFGSEVIAKL